MAKDNSKFIERMEQGRKSCDKAFEVMHDAIKNIILNAGGFINTANNDGKNDNIYSAVIDFDGTGELVEVLVKAVRVEDNEISCYIQPIYSNVKVIYTDEDMQEDEENWYLLSTSGELLYHYTILNLADVFSFGEYLPTEE